MNLKNVDIKLIAAATCFQLRPDLDGWIDQCQRGFMRSREALSNIVEFDAAARAAAFVAGTPPPEGAGDNDAALPCPVAFFFDFAAAFPSVSRQFLTAVLEAMQVPMPLRNCLRALLRRTTMDLCIDGMKFEGWTCHSGVPQGCNASAMFFVIASVPLLRLLQRAVQATRLPPAMPAQFCPRVGLILAYADDIGALTMDAQRDVARLAAVFVLIERRQALR